MQEDFHYYATYCAAYLAGYTHKECMTGIGKPEPLKYELTGKWSRRITSEHRLVYSVNDDRVEVDILSMKYHYSKK